VKLAAVPGGAQLIAAARQHSSHVRALKGCCPLPGG
jgi:hypothetical protein